MIDEDPFSPVASVNIIATDLRVVINAKKDERFSPNTRVRNVWIPKQYWVHEDDLVVKRSVYNQNKGKEWKVSIPFKTGNQEGEILKKKEYFSKRVTYFSRGKGHEHFKEENTSKVCYLFFCFTWAKVACGAAYEISPKAH